MARRLLSFTFFWIWLIACLPLAAQTIFVSPTGNDANPGTLAEPKRSLQSAILAVPSGGTIQVQAGTYNGGFSIQRKSFTLQGAVNPGDPKPVITLNFGPRNQNLFYIDNCQNVAIRGLRLDVNKTHCINGIYAIGNINNLVLNDLEIVAMATDSNNVSGGPGLYFQAVSIDGGPAGTPAPPQVTVSSTSVSPTITGRQTSTFYFNRGILVRSASGTIGGPSIASACTLTAERDILTQFIKGQLTIQSNQLRGGGIDVTLPEATGDVRLLDNTFTVDPRANFLLPEIVLFKHNANGAPILFQGNTITGHTNVALRSAGVRNAVIRGNTFIPNDSALNYRHIEVNTLWEGSTQTPVASNSVQIVGNQFREAVSAIGGTAIVLKNERKGAVAPAPDFSEVRIGGPAADANVFDQRVRKYLTLDARPGRTFTLDLDLAQNQFNISGAPELPSAMSQINLLALEDKFDHFIDADSVGLVRVKPNELYVTPKSFLRPNTTSASIQRAIARSASGDVVNIKDTIYQNPVLIDKALIFSMPGPATSIENLTMQTPAQTDRLTITQRLTVRGQIGLNSGLIKLGRNDLIAESASPTNPGVGSLASYVVTDSIGYLVENNLGATPHPYPIGTDTAFRPVLMANAGTADNVGLRIQPDVLSQATTGTPVDTVVRFTWFAREATPGGGSYSFTPLWYAVDEKPQFDRNSILVQRFQGGRWISFESAPRAASGTNPFTITQDTIQAPLTDLPLRLYGPQDIRDTIFYVDGDAGQDNFPLVSGRSPERAWRTINYAVNTAYRIAPSGLMHIRVKQIASGYTETINIPARQSRIVLRGGYSGADGLVVVNLPAGAPVLLQAKADSLYLDKFNFNITPASPGGRAIVLDSNAFYAVFDSLRLNSSQTGAPAGSGIVSLQAEPGRTRRLFLTATNISPAPGLIGFASGISGTTLSGIIGGNRPLVNNGITAPTTLDLTNLNGDSLIVARNTLLGDVSIKGSTASIRFNRNIVEGRSVIEGFAGPTSQARIDSNTFGSYSGVGLYTSNNRINRIRNNRFTPATAVVNLISLEINSEYSAPIPAGVQYATQDVAVMGNTFNQADVSSGIAILLSNEGAGQINPAFSALVIGGPGAQANTFNESHFKFLRLDPQPGAEFTFPVDARQNLYGINGQQKTPAAMSQPELFILENKIDHTVDYSPLGFVQVRDLQTFVTRVSFIPGFTSRPAIQRAVNPAQDGFEVHIEDFNYADTVTIDKALTFQSSGDTTISRSLVMNGVGKVLTLVRNYTLTNSLTLSRGFVRIQNNNLILTETAGLIQGGDSSSYVITAAIGTLVQRNIGPGAKADSVPFIIGTPASYMPLSIRNTGAVDEFRLRVFPGNFSLGITGTPEDSVVEATWILTEGTLGGSVLNITPQWNGTDEALDFDRTRSIVQGFFGNKWDFFGSRALKQAQGSDPYWVTEPSIAGRQFNNMPLRVYSYLPANVLFIPTLFSPNGDGRNDRFLLYSQNLVGGSINFKIYNRYGNVLFESSDPERLTTDGWDGRVNGKPVNTGTYVWQLTGKFRDGRPLDVEGKTVGKFTLIR